MKSCCETRCLPEVLHKWLILEGNSLIVPESLHQACCCWPGLDQLAVQHLKSVQRLPQPSQHFKHTSPCVGPLLPWCSKPILSAVSMNLPASASVRTASTCIRHDRNSSDIRQQRTANTAETARTLKVGCSIHAATDLPQTLAARGLKVTHLEDVLL